MLDLDTLEQQVTGIVTATTDSMEGIQTDSKRGRSSSPEDGIGSPDSKARRVLLGTDSEHTASTEHTAQEIEALKSTIAQMNTALVTCMDILTQTNAKVKKQQDTTAELQADMTKLTQQQNMHALDVHSLLDTRHITLET